MTYRPLTNIDISLATTNVTRQGFGTPLFASAHRYFPERVRAYTSLTAAAEDLPTTSNAYKAVQGFFSLSPAPAVVKVGRREADLELTVATGATKSSLVFHAMSAGVTYSLPINITGEVDEAAVAAAIAAAIEGDSDIRDLVVASATADTVFVDVASSASEFWVSNLSDELSEVYNTTETATALIAALADEDDDFYFFLADDHTSTFQEAASADIEARLKMYFTSTQDVTTLTPYTAGSATDTAGKFKDSSRDRTKVFFHHNADTIFPETMHVAANAPYDAGSVAWANIRLPLSISQNPNTGRALTATEKGYLEDRNVSYGERAVSIGVTTDGTTLRNNLTPSGEWISNVRGRDNLQVDLDAEMLTLLLSQKGARIPYSDEGIALIKASVRNVLDIYVLRNFIRADYELNFTKASDMPLTAKQQGLYDGASFSAELAQGILFVDLTGSLTLNLG